MHEPVIRPISRTLRCNRAATARGAFDPDRAARDTGKIAEEVLQHLTVLTKAKMRVTVEIDAEVPDGVSEDTQCVVTENRQTLRFKSHGFEKS